MNILLIIPCLKGGGSERVASLLAQEWNKHHDVTIVVFDDSIRHYDSGEVPVVNLNVPPPDIRFLRGYRAAIRAAKLLRFISRHSPDKIVSFLEVCNYPAILAAAMTGYLDRLTVSVRSNPARFPLSRRLALPVFYQFPDRIVAVSHGVGRKLIQFGVPSAKITTILNPSRSPRETSGNYISLPSPFILAVGRIVPQKGFDRLLRAFSGVCHSNLHLAIAGEGPDLRKLQRLACSLGISDRVHWLGWVADVDSLYRAAACFVLSSRWEGWANVLPEAMASGCPVVAYNCDYGSSEIVEHGKSGLLVPEGDIDGLGFAIDRVLSDSGLRDKLSDGGKSRAAMFDMEKIADRWLEE